LLKNSKLSAETHGTQLNHWLEMKIVSG